jgi:hypothetical protein
LQHGLDFAFVKQRVLSRNRPAHRLENGQRQEHSPLHSVDALLKRERLPEGTEWLS